MLILRKKSLSLVCAENKALPNSYADWTNTLGNCSC